MRQGSPKAPRLVYDALMEDLSVLGPLFAARGYVLSRAVGKRTRESWVKGMSW